MTSALPEPVRLMPTPLRMDYTFVAGAGRSTFLRGLAERKFLARGCPGCGKVYLPAPEFCARCLAELGEPIELDGRGTVSTFCVVSFPFPGQEIEPPYVVAHIHPDGADTRFMHLIREAEIDAVHIGMRVEPVWSDAAPEPSWTSIRHYRPLEEAHRA
ncbi:Zn-ribbon domain-containing OB-fold protein [Nocardia puris]|uniref:Putative OB-fold protein n=2 Tax=Nocardia puris TaxID=208602 RepID=A0A366CYS2_9NOCA|nr:Zn-ribbon domain-containing OB-fold protein [Nocardia puris]RBO82972.1 putative OB-fold protein [Nocardia puris]